MVPGTFFRFYLYSTPPPLSQKAKKSIMREEREHSCGRETTRNENRGKIVNLGGVKMENFGGMSLVKKISVTGMGIALFVVLTLCHLVIRMHLNGEVFVSINDLGEERELVVVFPRYLLSKDFLRSAVYYLREVIACPCAILDL